MESLILRYFSNELLLKLVEINRTHYDTNNQKFLAALDILNEYGVEYTLLGPGTNRFAIQIEQFAFKIAMDRPGIIDNLNEAAVSRELQPYVTKIFESNKLITVHELVVPLTKEEFQLNKPVIQEMLSTIKDNYLLGDVSLNETNFLNWGKRDNGDLVILDYGYVFPIPLSSMVCSTCDARLSYDQNYMFLRCPRGHKETFIDVKRRIGRKSIEESIIAKYNQLDSHDTIIIDIDSNNTEINEEDISMKNKHTEKSHDNSMYTDDLIRILRDKSNVVKPQQTFTTPNVNPYIQYMNKSMESHSHTSHQSKNISNIYNLPLRKKMYLLNTLKSYKTLDQGTIETLIDMTLRTFDYIINKISLDGLYNESIMLLAMCHTITLIMNQNIPSDAYVVSKPMLMALRNIILESDQYKRLCENPSDVTSNEKYKIYFSNNSEPNGKISSVPIGQFVKKMYDAVPFKSYKELLDKTDNVITLNELRSDYVSTLDMICELNIMYIATSGGTFKDISITSEEHDVPMATKLDTYNIFIKNQEAVKVEPSKYVEPIKDTTTSDHAGLNSNAKVLEDVDDGLNIVSDVNINEDLDKSSLTNDIVNETNSSNLTPIVVTYDTDVQQPVQSKPTRPKLVFPENDEINTSIEVTVNPIDNNLNLSDTLDTIKSKLLSVFDMYGDSHDKYWTASTKVIALRDRVSDGNTITIGDINDAITFSKISESVPDLTEHDIYDIKNHIIDSIIYLINLIK